MVWYGMVGGLLAPESGKGEGLWGFFFTGALVAAAGREQG